MLLFDLLLMSMLVTISVLSYKQYNTVRPTTVYPMVRRYSELQRELAELASITPTYEGVVDECEETADFCYATVEVSDIDRVVLLDYLSVGIDV